MLFGEIIEKNASKLLKVEANGGLKLIDLPSGILKLFNVLSEDESWNFEQLTRKETAYTSHGYHRYPAKFIPQLARRCIEEYTKENDVVCDPFMGCSTTLVEALIAGRKAIGVDINPVAWLITKVKATPIPPDKLNKEITKFFRGSNRLY